MVRRKEFSHMEMSPDLLILRRISQLHLNLVHGRMTKYAVVITRTPQR